MSKPEDLRMTGYGYGSGGCSLAHCLASVGRECGVLEEYQYAELVEGFQDGTRDYAAFKSDMQSANAAGPICWDEVPL